MYETGKKEPGECISSTRETEVSRELEQLANNIAAMRSSTETLRERINPILSNHPVGQPEKGKDVEPSCPLAGLIAQARREVASCTQEIRDIIELCAL